VRPGRETSMHYFSLSVWPCVNPKKKRAGTCYVEHVFLHPGRPRGHVVGYGASGVQNINALIFMLGRAWCGSHKNHANTRYVELVFLHPVRSAGHVMHSSASRA
jgi:hypothetical protein